LFHGDAFREHKAISTYANNNNDDDYVDNQTAFISSPPEIPFGDEIRYYTSARNCSKELLKQNEGAASDEVFIN